MGLTANVARRGGVYWWRGRIGPSRTPSRVIAKSLRTCDPEIARAVGSQITGMAAQLRQRVRCGTMTVEQAANEIGTFLARFPFSVDPKVIEQLRSEDASPVSRATAASTAYSTEQEHAMLLDFARRMGPILDRRADEVRTRPTFVLDGVRSDWVGDAIRNDRIQAEVCRLLALAGTSACVRPNDRPALLERAFSDEDIDEIDLLARQHAPREGAFDWLIGPEREVVVFHLQSVGTMATTENIARLRRAALFVLADLLQTHVKGYQAVPEHYGAIAVGVSRMVDHSALVASPVAGQRKLPHPIASLASSGQTSKGPVRAAAASDASFLALVETLIRAKTQAKTREWDIKTARQHRSVAGIFVKNAGTDDPAAMTQEHIGSYLDLLHVIPTHYGKSAADEHRTIEEILARGEDLDEDEIGLAAPTINRHRTQLGTILGHMEENGFPIGVITKKSRAKDPEGPEGKRIAFTTDDGVRLMAVLDRRNGEGDCVDPDALFWVPILCWYLLLRLSEAAGLAPSDIDLVEGVIHIQQNGLRRLKTRSSKRSFPIPQEMVRLGFLRFVARRQAAACPQLFPGLFTRKSDFAVAFQKMWTPILDKALPGARRDRKTLHSTRKGGNSAMVAGHIPEPTRLYMMGHAKLDTNGRHYTSPPSNDEIADALKCILVVTTDLVDRT